jgi:hypothetical protein
MSIAARTVAFAASFFMEADRIWLQFRRVFSIKITERLLSTLQRL